MRSFLDSGLGISTVTEIFEIIGVVFAIISCFILFRLEQKRRNRKQIEEETKLAKPKLYFHSFSINDGEEYNIYIGIPKGDYKNHLSVISQFPIGIGNHGGSDLEIIDLILKHAPCSPIVLSNDVIELGEKPFAPIQKRSFYKDGEQQCVSFKIDSIRPKSLLHVNELIKLYPHMLYTEAPGTTKDGVNIIMNIGSEISYFFEVILTAKNFPPQRIKFHLHACESTDFDELKEIYFKRMQTLSINEKYRESKDKNSFLFFPDFKILRENKKYKSLQGFVNSSLFAKMIYEDGMFYNESEHPKFKKNLKI